MWINKIKNTGILQDLNNEANGLLDSIKSWKLKYFGYIKHYSGFRKNAVV